MAKVEGKRLGSPASRIAFPGRERSWIDKSKRVNRANPIPLTPSSKVLHTVQCGGAQMQRTFSPASVEYLPTGELTPYPRNARTHSKKQIKAIARSIERFGFTNPGLATSANEILVAPAGRGRKASRHEHRSGSPDRSSERSRATGLYSSRQ